MGKSKAPPAPDYSAAANATAQGNLEMAKYATNANRINQDTPYGSLTYEYIPQYDAQGNETGAGWTQTETLTPEAQAALDQQLALNQKYGEVANIGFDKTRNIFENPELDTFGLPEISGVNAGLLGGVRDFNAQGLNNVRSLDFSGLNQVRGIDQSALPQASINPGATAQQAIMSRLQPQLSQQEEALRTRLANQGITLGSEAYNREMNQQGQRANDLQLQAAAQGISLDQAARQQAFGEQQGISANDMARRQMGVGEQQILQAGDLSQRQQGLGERQSMSSFDAQRRAQQLAEQGAISANSADMRARALQEQAMLQDRPLNLINALRTGNQVNAPQFQQFSQQATTQGPDMLGATQAQYNAALGSTNAANAGTSGMLGGLLGVGAGVAGLPVKGGGSLFGNFLTR
jgi:hypothetical protein